MRRDADTRCLLKQIKHLGNFICYGRTSFSSGLFALMLRSGAIHLCAGLGRYYLFLKILACLTSNPVYSWMGSPLERASVLSHPVCSSLLSRRTMEAGGSLTLGCYWFPGSFASSFATVSKTLQYPGLNRHRQHLLYKTTPAALKIPEGTQRRTRRSPVFILSSILIQVLRTND